MLIPRALLNEALATCVLPAQHALQQEIDHSRVVLLFHYGVTSWFRSHASNPAECDISYPVWITAVRFDSFTRSSSFLTSSSCEQAEELTMRFIRSADRLHPV